MSNQFYAFALLHWYNETIKLIFNVASLLQSSDHFDTEDASREPLFILRSIHSVSEGAAK